MFVQKIRKWNGWGVLAISLCFFLRVANEGWAELSVKESLYEGAVFKGAKAITLESDAIKVVVLPEQGGRVVELWNKKTGFEVIRSKEEKLKFDYGLWDRVGKLGEATYQAEVLEKGPDKASLLLTGVEGNLKVERTLTLFPASPRLHVKIKHINTGKDLLKTRVWSQFQFLLEKDGNLLGDWLVLPKPEGGYGVYQKYGTYSHERKYGFIYNRDGNGALVWTASLEEPIQFLYCYWNPGYYHFITAGIETNLAPNQSVALEYDLWHIASAADAVSFDQIGYFNKDVLKELKTALTTELSRPSATLWTYDMPEVRTEEVVPVPPQENPLATFIVYAGPCLYDPLNPPKGNDVQEKCYGRKSLLETIPEINAIHPDMVIFIGQLTLHGVDKEVKELDKLRGFIKSPTVIAQEGKSFDLKDSVHFAALPADNPSKETLEWLKEDLKKSKAKHILFLSNKAPARLPASATTWKKYEPSTEPLGLDGIFGENRERLSLWLAAAPSKDHPWRENFFYKDIVLSLQAENSQLRHRFDYISYQVGYVYPDRIDLIDRKVVGANIGSFISIPRGVKRPDGQEKLLPLPSWATKGKKLFTFAVVADPQSFETNNLLAVEEIRAMPEVELIVFPGDITGSTKEEEYKAFWEAYKNVGKPCYLVPGNHDWANCPPPDVYANYRKWSGQPDHQAISHKEVQFLLHSTVSGKVKGVGGVIIPPDQWGWLKGQLDKSKGVRQVVDVTHFPINGTLDYQELVDLLTSNKVTAILTGDTHRDLPPFFFKGGLVDINHGTTSYPKYGKEYSCYYIYHVYEDRLVSCLKYLHENVPSFLIIPNPRGPKK